MRLSFGVSHGFDKGRYRGVLNCTEVVELVVEYLEGDLSPEVRADMLSHLEDCRYCREFLREYQRTSVITREALAESMPAELEERLVRFLRSRIREE